MWVDTRSGLDRTAQNIWIFLRVLEQGAQVTDDQEAHALLVATGQGRGGEGFGDEVGGPAAQLNVGFGTGERKDAHHDLRVVGLRVAEDGLFGLVQLLKLVAHGLHIGGRHDGHSSRGRRGCRRQAAR